MKPPSITGWLSEFAHMTIRSKSALTLFEVGKHLPKNGTEPSIARFRASGGKKDTEIKWMGGGNAWNLGRIEKTQLSNFHPAVHTRYPKLTEDHPILVSRFHQKIKCFVAEKCLLAPVSRHYTVLYMRDLCFNTFKYKYTLIYRKISALLFVILCIGFTHISVCVQGLRKK